MSISPSYPYNLQNGTTGDATQVMANFLQIQNDVNANAAENGVNSSITQLTGLTTPLSIPQGGTGSVTALLALAALGGAARGTNSDITSLLGLTTPLSVAQGGSGSTTATAARTAFGAAASGANADITSLTALTTPLAPLASPGFTGTPTAPTAAPGTNTTQLATTAFVLANHTFTPGFTSAETSIATSVSVAHSLGGVPSFIRVVIRCKTAELGYSVGDEVDCAGSDNDNGGSNNMGANATNVFFTTRNGGIVIPPLAGGATQITNANWKLVFRAWL